jgi:hypothetical protein
VGQASPRGVMKVQKVELRVCSVRDRVRPHCDSFIMICLHGPGHISSGCQVCVYGDLPTLQNGEPRAPPSTLFLPLGVQAASMACFMCELDQVVVSVWSDTSLDVAVKVFIRCD